MNAKFIIKPLKWEYDNELGKLRGKAQGIRNYEVIEYPDHFKMRSEGLMMGAKDLNEARNHAQNDHESILASRFLEEIW